MKIYNVELINGVKPGESATRLAIEFKVFRLVRRIVFRIEDLRRIKEVLR